MLYTFSDAVELALDMYKAGYVRFTDLDYAVKEIWREMQEENENR